MLECLIIKPEDKENERPMKVNNLRSLLKSIYYDQPIALRHSLMMNNHCQKIVFRAIP